jgi:DNA-binding NarL/FixJ family response regulator
MAQHDTAGGMVDGQGAREALFAPNWRRPLTSREKQVVRLVVAGRSNNQIAARLGVSLATVKRHLANVMLKWECHNRTQVAVAAIAAGALVSVSSR